ncbi:MAG: MFS transporter, partial [Pseudomonadota bacterium]
MAVGATDPSRPIAGHRPSFCEARNRRFLLIAAILASALGFIDGTLVAIALPAIRAGLDATLTQALWINNGYLLPLSALILMGGALGDRFGLGRVFALGIGVFIAASVACALAPSPGFLIVARVIQGIGAALMVPGSLALIARAYPEEERGRAIGTWAAASALTTALGPILAGLALSLGGPEIWRWLFAINLPLGAIALFLVLRFVADDRAQPDHPLDLPGAALITGGLGLVTYALTAAGEHGGLANPGLLALGAALIAAFILWQARITNPMVPLGLFRDRGFAGANIATALIYLALSAILFFLPMTLIAGWGLAEIWASAAFAPLSILIPVLSAPAGRLADRYGAGPLIGLGAACVAVSFAALAAVVPVGPTALWWGVL